MTMTTYIDAACRPPIPAPLPPFSPAVPPTPRPLGIRRALAWLALAVIASFTAPVLCGIAAGLWDSARPAQRLPEGLLDCMIGAFALAGFFAVVVLACQRSHWRAVDYLALTPPRGPWLRLGALAFIIPFAVIVTAAYVGPSGLGGLPSTPVDLALLLVGVVVIAPIAEELAFRGFLLRALAESRLGAAGAIVITAAVWASLHIEKSWLSMGATFFTGPAWGWLRWRTQSTLTTIAVHALNNVVAGVGPAVASLAG